MGLFLNYLAKGNEVTFPLAKPGQTRKPDPENDCGFQVMEDINTFNLSWIEP